MKKNYLKRILSTGLALLAGTALSPAQTSGVWTNNASGVWSGATNWLNGAVADGAGATADFSQANLTANRTVTLDANHNLGNLIFGNATSGYNWLLAGGGGAVNLTNAAAGPAFAVTNIAVITASLTGSQGLAKTGPGLLALGGQDSYGGATTVGAGTLQLTNSLSTAPVLYLSFDDVSGKTVVNQGTGGSAMNGTITGTATISTNSGRYGNALSIPSGAANAAYVLVNNPVVALTGAKTWTVAMWVKTSTAGGVYAYQGSGGWGSGNMVFYANEGSDGGYGTHAGGVSYAQGWEQGSTVLTDGNWHFLVMTCNGSSKALYFDGNVDAIQTSWAANTGVGTQFWIGGAADTGDKDVGLSGLVDEVYVYNYALSQAQVQSLMATTNSAILPPLPVTSPVAVAAGSKLDLNGISATVAGLTGSGTVDTTLASGTPTLVINNTNNVEFDGLFTNTTGTLALTKTGAAMLTLGGTNSIAGATAVSAGIVALTNNATLNVSSSASLQVGNVAGQSAAFYQVAGTTVNENDSALGGFQIGSVAGAAGYYNISGGTINAAGEIDPGGSSGGAGTFGQFDMSGGTINLPNSTSTYFLPNRGASGEASVVNISGGTVQIANGGTPANNGINGYSISWAAGAQTNVTTISGGGQLLTPSLEVKLNQGSAYNAAGNAGNWTTLNLNGGVLQTLGFENGAASANVNTFINFNGGTLQAGTAANASFLANLGGAYVYGGGATINDNGQLIVIGQQLLAPSGNGVSSIPVTAGGAGYVTPPQVFISDSTGGGATAYAQISGGAVTGIVVTSPGNNYTAPTVTLAGGGYTTAATVGTATVTANISGGLTKTGGGTLTLTNGATYTGPTVVNGGTLSIPANVFAPATAGNLVVSNGNFAPNVSGGVAFPAASVTLQNNAVLTLAYGPLSGNPSFPAINATGNLAAPGANIVINITGSGFANGQFPLIKYTGSGPASIAGIKLGSLPGIAASLVNNAANKSLDLLIVPTQTLTWYGEENANWDFVSSNWNNGSATLGFYKNYTNAVSGVLYGDVVTLDDTLYNNGVTPPNTNIVLGVTVYPNTLTENSASTYAITGAGGISGAGSVTLNGSGTFLEGTVNSYTGGTFINAGTLIVKSDTGLGTAAGLVTLNGGTLAFAGNSSGTRPITFTAGSSIDVAPGLTAQLGGSLSGAGTYTEVDGGTAVLSGASTNAPPLVVSAGTVDVTGTYNDLNAITVGNIGGNNAVLQIAGGNLLANENPGQFSSSLIVGGAAGAAGDLQLTSGSLLVNQQFGLGAGTGGYAAFSMSGGTAAIGSFVVVGFNNDTSVLNLSGGSLAISNNLITIGAGGAGAIGVANLTGGTFKSTATTGYGPTIGGAFVGEVGTGTLNISGNASLLLSGWGLRVGQDAGANGTANLDGGVVTTVSASQGGGTGTLNFDGGTLKASAANTAFVAGFNSAVIYNRGATIDDGGFAITIPQVLQAPSGYGVSSTTLASGGTGYIDTPLVVISGGTGSGATAVATVSGGAVTGITVTAPGTGYSNGDGLTVTLLGGGGSGASANTPVLAANAGGGLTKLGAGTLTLSGANSYAGSTVISNGELYVTSASQSNGAVTVEDGAAFGLQLSTNATLSLANLTLGTTSTGTNLVDLAFASGNSTVPAISTGTLTLNGTNTLRLTGRFTVGAIPLIHYSALAGGGKFSTNVIAPQGVVVVVSNSVAQSTVYAVIVTTGPGLFWSGASPVSPNLWDIGITTNWLLGATKTVYQQTVIPGDFVNFTDSGSGAVTANTTVSPDGIVISNNATSYAFTGTGSIGGVASLTKLGSGSVTLGLTGDSFAGGTTISNGTVTLGAANAIGSGNLALAPTGTLELAGNSQSVNGLSGSGTIDNDIAANVTLTTGSGGGGLWSGTITNVAVGGGVCWIDNGTNTLFVNGANYLTGPTASEVQNGRLVITNGGVLSLPNSEFWIGANASVTGEVEVAGGTLSVADNWLVIGRANAAANGTLIVNSGTVQKSGANNIVVGSLGATGTLIVNGGQVLNNSDLWLGEGPTAVAALYLNGGLLQATAVRPNDNGGLPTAGSFAYFNGGILQADRSTNDFLELPSPGAALVLSNGFILDDGGFTIGIQIPLAAGDGFNGGLVKQGAGTVYLDAYSSYSGTTVVTNGTLAGVGGIAGPVVVGPAGNLGAGDAGAPGTFNLQSTLILNGNATFRISKTGGVDANDQIAGITAAAFGGVLTVTNVTSDGTALTTSDTFPLFSTGGTGNFTSIVGSPGPGLAYSFNPASGVLSVVTGNTIAGNSTNLTATVSGSTLTIAWPADHLGWILQSQTNRLNIGLSNNWYDVTGSAAATNSVISIDATAPAVFYRLRHP